MNVLSLFDGISGAQVALKRSGIQVDKYYSSEIDKYAMQVTQYHFPDTIQLGDINDWRNWDIDFSKIDFLVGGFPCFGSGTKIITSDGYKNIEDIKEGDLVLTHEKRFRKVINTNCKKGKVCKLKAEGILETITTMNHPYYVRQVSNENKISHPYWEEVRNLEIGIHHIVIPMEKMGKKGIAKDGFILYPVKSVDDTDEIQNVYNFEVEEDNSYTANNAVVHNCQSWSLAGKQKGDTDPRGNLVHVLIELWHHIREKNPNLKFLFENVKMKKEFIDYINNLFKDIPICINSALVSAQNRQRLYWTNIPRVRQPKDKGIVIKDILESGESDREKSHCIDANYFKGGSVKNYLEKKRRQMVLSQSDIRLMVKDVKCGAFRGRNPDNTKSRKSGEHTEQHLEIREDDKTNCLTTVYKDNLIVFKNKSQTDKNKCKQVGKIDSIDYDIASRVYDIDYKSPVLRKCGDVINITENKLTWRKLTPLECERLQTYDDGYTEILSNT